MGLLQAPSVVTTTYPAVSAGNNRKACLCVSRVQGGGSAALPTSVTIGGQAATKQGGFPDGSFNRLTTAVYALDESQIAAMSGNAISLSGGNFGGQLLLAFVLEDITQGVPANSAYEHSGGSVTAGDVGLARVDNGFTWYGVLINTLTVANLTNPDEINNQQGSGACYTYGYQIETSDNTSNASYTSSSQLSGQVAINFAPYVVTPGIVSIDGDATPELPDEAAGLDVITQNLGAVTSGNLGGRAILVNSTGSNTCNIDFPLREDGMVWPSLPDAITLTLTSGANSPSISVDITLKDDEAKVVFADVDATTQTGLGYHLAQAGYPLSDDDECYYPSLEGELVINPDSSVDINALQTVLLWIRRNSDEVWNSFNVTFEDNAVVSVNRSVKKLASSNITAKKITAKKISSKKF